MTCIVGIVDKVNKKVYIGGDAAGSDGFTKSIRTAPKVFKLQNGKFIFGYTSSFRMGQVIQYKFKPPDHLKKLNVVAYMVTLFIDELRKCLKDNGYSKIDNNVERGGTFLVGYKGRLFCIQGDYQVSEVQCGYDACGSGEYHALGSMRTTAKLNWNCKVKLKNAMEAAQANIVTVQGPFTILSGGIE